MRAPSRSNASAESTLPAPAVRTSPPGPREQGRDPGRVGELGAQAMVIPGRTSAARSTSSFALIPGTGSSRAG